VEARPSTTVIEFLGAAGTVTGSRFLVDAPRSRVLLDCGLYQGRKALRERNWAAFPVDAESIDAVVLSHAHVDHSGFLPGLYRAGFRGRVYATPGTTALCEIVLPDSARLQEEDAAYANRKGFSKHRPALPLYGEKEAEEVLARFRPVPYGERVEVADGVTAELRPAGHILGAASVSLHVAGSEHRIAFSGDLGRPSHPILNPPAPPAEADALLVESTYGDRRHADADVIERFASEVRATAERGGVVVIPAFAVDRTELVLLHLKRLTLAGEIPELPVYVDSPMALAALGVYRRAIAERAPEIRTALHGADDPFDWGGLVEARSADASRAINAEKGPAVIVSASGMATGGRVLHHLAQRLPDPRNSVLLVGFQTEETRGARLLEGARLVKMLGRYVPVRARVVDLAAFSVHADAAEILAWLGAAPRAPEIAYVVHGEPRASAALRDAIERELGWNCVVPRYRERVRVDGPPRGGPPAPAQ
jgi:metallo-beta-lactamase family protein